MTETKTSKRTTAKVQEAAFEGQKRVVIEGVKPEVDGGRFAVKRTVGEWVVVEADIFCDGHDMITAVLHYKKEEDDHWTEVEMEALVNDRWRARFRVREMVRYAYTLSAWIDHFKSWRRDLFKRIDAGQVKDADLLMGAELVAQAAERAPELDRKWFLNAVNKLRSDDSISNRLEVAQSDELAQMMARYPDRSLSTEYGKVLCVSVDREKARFSAWYEMFPRSCSDKPGVHGTFKDAAKRLEYVASLGFDVVYLPPIHPVGFTNRKGKNNSTVAEPGDVGSPWAIGGPDGGHKAILPDLGTMPDFQNFLKRAEELGIEIALDVAFQCSPDHPYAKEHPEWFKHRPDGSIQYAENPPKKYEDIYPFDFESPDWKALWDELLSIFQFWIDRGIRIFRVDNPHTKPFPLWEYIIGNIKSQYPETIFLAEAFTRPKIMYNLAKLGFNQSYTYFAWRNRKWEIEAYFNELTKTDVREYFRPNLWPNTPDILTEYLQTGGRAAFVNRLILAATLGANYGIYGPAFELCEHVPRSHGSEEYHNSEKYQLRHWEIDRPDSLREMISLVNFIRKDNPALHGDGNLLFHPVDNEQLICYSKHTDDFSNVILVVVNLDPYHTQSGWLNIPIQELGIENEQSYQIHDLLSDARYLWHGPHNYVELNPHVVPAHILRLKRHLRTERDFEYFA